MSSRDINRIRDNQGNGPSFPAYSLPLYLPSSILPAHPCDEIIVCAESRLRIAQGYDLLHTIHSQLLSLSKAYKDGDTNVLTQKERLKCHKTTRDFNARITQAKQYYRDVRKRLTILSTMLGEWGWRAQLRVLEDSDVRRIADDEVGISEGNRSMSWIWYSSHLGDVPGGVEECTSSLFIAYFCIPYPCLQVCRLSGARLVPEHIDGVRNASYSRSKWIVSSAPSSTIGICGCSVLSSPRKGLLSSMPVKVLVHTRNTRL